MEFPRQHFRLDDYLKCSYKYELASSKVVQGESLILDISGGGTMMISSSGIPRGKIIEINIDPPLGPLKLKGEVVKSQVNWYVDDDGKKMYWNIHIAFKNIDQEDRKKVIRYVYKCAGERRKARIKSWRIQ